MANTERILLLQHMDMKQMYILFYHNFIIYNKFHILKHVLSYFNRQTGHIIMPDIWKLNISECDLLLL